MTEELERIVKACLAEVATSDDTEAAIEKAKQTDNAIGFPVWDVYRLIGRDAARLAASTLANYRLETALRIAQALRPHEKTTDAEKLSIRAGYHLLNDARVAGVTNRFPDANHATLADDPIWNLASYAAAKEQAYRDALMALFSNYAQNPEVVSAALSSRMKEFPQFVQLLASKELKRVIMSHSGNLTRGKLVADLHETFGHGEDLFSVWGMVRLLAELSPKYMPDSGIRADDLEKMVWHLTSLSAYLTEQVEPLLEKYRGFEQQVIDLVLDIRKIGPRLSSPWYDVEERLSGHSLDAFLSMIDKSPSVRIGLDVARLAFDLYKETRVERRHRINNLMKALSSEAYREALVKADAHQLRDMALRGLVYEAHWPSMRITENVARMLTSSSYDRVEDVEDFFNAVRDSGRYMKQLYKLLNLNTALSEKTAVLRLFGELKKSGVGTSDPVPEKSWKEDSAMRAKLLLLEKAAKQSDGVRVDDLTSQEVMQLSVDQLVDFLGVSDRPGDNRGIFEYSGFGSQEYFLVSLADARKAKARHWPLGKEYGTLTNVDGKMHNSAKLAELFVAGLIGRAPEKVQAAMDAFGSNMELARAYVMKRVEPKKAYHALKPSLNGLREGDLGAVDKVVAYFRELFKGETLKGNSNRRGIEALSDLTEDIIGIAMEKNPISRLTAKMQSVVPTDLFDNRLLHACTFYPSGVNKEASINYIRNAAISLLYFNAQTNGSYQKRGAAILVLKKLADGRTALLVDSVEGSPNLRLVNGWDAFALDSVIAVAADAKADVLIVNERVLGNTAKGFVNYVSLQGRAKHGFFILPELSDIGRLGGLEGMTYDDNGKKVINGYELPVKTAQLL